MEIDNVLPADGHPKALQRWIYENIAFTADVNERHSLSNLIMRHFFDMEGADFVINEKRKFRAEDLNRIKEVISRLNNHEPIQYILDEADFYGRKFYVNSDVLIPRQETELLVDCVIKENPKKGLNLVDIGTGSGCIAISLKLELAGASVTGIDFDEKTLRCARRNGAKHMVDISWGKLDILKDELPSPANDIVVSNPPYVRESEKALMQRNVLENEPYAALFVNDQDPLIFYRAIARKAIKSLSAGGKIYLEINEAFGSEVRALLENEGYGQVQLIKDLQQKYRIVKGVKSG